MIRGPKEGERCVLGGVVGGIVGGLALSFFAIARALIDGADIWPALKTASLPFVGARALDSGFDLTPLTLGVSTHFAIAIAWGVVFAVLAYGLSRAATLAAALGWGLVVWFGMSYVALPLLGFRDFARSQDANMALFQHLLFGLALGIGFLPFQRPYTFRAPARAVP
jgi:hypothetical protein